MTYELIHATRDVFDVFMDIEPKAANELFTAEEVRAICTEACEKARVIAANSGQLVKYGRNEEIAYQTARLFKQTKQDRLAAAEVN